MLDELVDMTLVKGHLAVSAILALSAILAVFQGFLTALAVQDTQKLINL